MASSSAEQPKDERDSFVSLAIGLATPELESAIEALQDMLRERKIQSYDLDTYGTNSLVGLDKTKLKLVSLKQPSQEHKDFVQSQGNIYPDKTECWMFHIGSGAFEIQYGWQENQISAGTELGQRSVFAFGPAILSAGFPEHSSLSKEIRSGFRKLVKRLNEDCGDVAPWKWDMNKAVQLVCWASELIGETDRHLNNAVCSILERGDDEELESDEDYEESDEGDDEEGDEEGEEESDEDVEE
ncbi:hypothetical protein PILCRDRAFT_812603 [Piloderma croceum F 1598]|uniref:Uncharacterized protein n=1 Tax=Piloderma croceum (strain F 1598) TaxID=765440 RepID=A0A0C3GDN1_PILCF|nr:hypothetical protein PILCRDRAFT_812603 [Piloderma croceum F 1598]